MRNKTNKRPYRVRNWPEYNRSLVSRGSLTVWLDESVLQNWGVPQPTGKRGAMPLYNDTAIVLALTLRTVYRQTLRGTQGFLQSVFALMNLGHLPVPDYSTLCRRARRLEIDLASKAANGPLHLVVDSTGCKVFGEGEWKVRKHGWSKRRTWRTIHLGVDESSGQIKAAVFTTNDFGDGEVLPRLLHQVEEPLGQVSGDGAYDQRSCYESLQQRGKEQGLPVRAAIPPRKNARISRHGNCREEPLPRDENIRRVRAIGRKRWKEEIGYHRRSLAETTMFRLKTIFGDHLQSRLFENQATEMFIRCRVLNQMNEMGKPESIKMEALL